jgi:hypothetical protein
MSNYYTLKLSFIRNRVICYLTENVLKDYAKSKHMVDNKFYYYRMWCRGHGKFTMSLPDLCDKQDWIADTKNYKIMHDDGTLDEVAIEKTKEGYFGKIYRTKPKFQHYGKNEGDSKIKDLKTDVDLVGEKEKDITYFAFLPFRMHDLLFLTEVHSGNRGMTIIKEFFKHLVPETHEIKSEPLKTQKLLDLKKYAPKELKKIMVTFKREPVIPTEIKLPVEEIMKRLKIEEDYQIIVGARIRVSKKNKKVFSTLDNAFNTIFGKSLGKAIDEGVDFPEILSSVDVAFSDNKSNKTWDILKDYEREMIQLQKGNLSDTEIRKILFDKLKSKLKEMDKNG